MTDLNNIIVTRAVRSIRGAITAENTPDDIKDATVELINKMLSENNIDINNICFVNFSATKDLNADYPAKYARIHCGFKNVPMMCFQEMHVENSLKNCIRILMVVNSDKQQNEFKHQYLKGAIVLRQDLCQINE